LRRQLELLAPLLAAGIALAGGLTGFRLIPDTGLYERAGFHLWPAPLGGLAGTVAGATGVIVASAIAAALLVQLVPRRRRLLVLGLSSYWLLFPGVDALGAALALMFVHSGRRGLWILSGLAHPVAALTTSPLLWRRDESGLILAAALTVATIAAVGLLDGFSTTDRYLLPVLAIALSGLARSSSRDFVDEPLGATS
jgi:hypothetical protein